MINRADKPTDHPETAAVLINHEYPAFQKHLHCFLAFSIISIDNGFYQIFVIIFGMKYWRMKYD
jgi:hypothetical protein